MVFTSYKGTLAPMNIGMHLKGGWGSRRKLSSCAVVNCKILTNTKPGFKVKLNFGVGNEKQSLYGVTELTLNSMVQDPTMLRETTDYRLARALGLPSPRTGYAYVYVNGVDFGLHLLVETYAKPMFSRWYPAGTQHSYEGAGRQDLITNATATVNNWGSLQWHDGPVATVGQDLKVIAGINDLNGPEWWQAMNQYTDVGELTKEWAFEHFAQHWDSYSWYVINNYYVHFDKNGIMTMLPWGMDQTLADFGGDQAVKFLDSVTVNGKTVGIMFTKCLAYTPCRQLYQSQLANVGVLSDSLNLPGFIDEVWQAIGTSVLTDRITQGSGAEWAKETAKWFLTSRTSIPEYLTAVTTRNRTNLTLSYPTPAAFSQGQVLQAEFASNSDKAPRFLVMGDPADLPCSIDAITGAVTVIRPGDCVVSMQTPAGPVRNANGSAGYHAGFVSTVVSVPKQKGSLMLTGTRLLPRFKPLPLEIQALSTGKQTVTTNASCTYSNGQLYANVQSGECLVTVSVEKDSRYTSVTANLTFTIGREVIRTYPVTTDPYFTNGTRLPRGQTLSLIHQALRASGSCVAKGKSLKALASAGICTVTIAAWNTEGETYVQKSFKILMGPSAQTWTSKVAPSVTKKKIGSASFQLANTPNVLTNLKNEGFFNSTGPCEIISDFNSTYVVMNGSGLCTVWLDADPGYKVPAIHQVWTFTK